MRDALSEIKNGRKLSCWMWYVFPQIIGLGRSHTAVFYSIRDLQEAKDYLHDEVLGKRLREICEALLDTEKTDAYAVFGFPDNLKLKSSMTLFEAADPDEPVFAAILERFFGGGRFDIGNTCARAIQRYQKGCVPVLCGSNKMSENGNGSLMRILPMAFALYGKYGTGITSSRKAMEDIHKISGLTHRHPLAQSSCGIYLAVACRILDGYELKAAIREGIQEALGWYGSHDQFIRCLDYWKRISDPERFAGEPEETIYSGSFVVESMETALWCLLNTDNYGDCVLRCVNMGYDADSTAAIAGGLAGLYYGYDGIPVEWVEQLAGKEIIEDCIRGMETCEVIK